MNKKLPFYLLSALLIFVSACKKEKATEPSLVGTWELNKITFTETNQTFPLDSFRNVFNVSLTLNSDFSFSETEDIGRATFGPLGSTTLTEYYSSPRNAKARYLIYDYIPKTWPTSRSFSIEQDLLVFKIAAQTPNSTQEEIYSRNFVLQNNNELDIERSLMVSNKENGGALTHKLKFSYRRK